MKSKSRYELDDKRSKYVRPRSRSRSNNRKRSRSRIRDISKSRIRDRSRSRGRGRSRSRGRGKDKSHVHSQRHNSSDSVHETRFIAQKSNLDDFSSHGKKKLKKAKKSKKSERSYSNPRMDQIDDQQKHHEQVRKERNEENQRELKRRQRAISRDDKQDDRRCNDKIRDNRGRNIISGDNKKRDVKRYTNIRDCARVDDRIRRNAPTSRIRESKQNRDQVLHNNQSNRLSARESSIERRQHHSAQYLALAREPTPQPPTPPLCPPSPITPPQFRGTHRQQSRAHRSRSPRFQQPSRVQRSRSPRPPLHHSRLQISRSPHARTHMSRQRSISPHARTHISRQRSISPLQHSRLRNVSTSPRNRSTTHRATRPFRNVRNHSSSSFSDHTSCERFSTRNELQSPERYKKRGERKTRTRRQPTRHDLDINDKIETEQQYNNSVERFLQDTTRALKQKPSEIKTRQLSPQLSSRHRPLSPLQTDRTNRQGQSIRNNNSRQMLRPNVSSISNISSRRQIGNVLNKQIRQRHNSPPKEEIAVSHAQRLEESRLIVEQDRRERARIDNSHVDNVRVDNTRVDNVRMDNVRLDNVRIDNVRRDKPRSNTSHIPALLPPQHQTFSVGRTNFRTHAPFSRTTTTNIAPLRRSAHERLGVRVNNAPPRPLMQNIPIQTNTSRRGNIRDRLGAKFDARNVITPRLNTTSASNLPRLLPSFEEREKLREQSRISTNSSNKDRVNHNTNTTHDKQAEYSDLSEDDNIDPTQRRESTSQSNSRKQLSGSRSRSFNDERDSRRRNDCRDSRLDDYDRKQQRQDNRINVERNLLNDNQDDSENLAKKTSDAYNETPSKEIEHNNKDQEFQDVDQSHSSDLVVEREKESEGDCKNSKSFSDLDASYQSYSSYSSTYSSLSNHSQVSNENIDGNKNHTNEHLDIKQDEEEKKDIDNHREETQTQPDNSSSTLPETNACSNSTNLETSNISENQINNCKNLLSEEEFSDYEEMDFNENSPRCETNLLDCKFSNRSSSSSSGDSSLSSSTSSSSTSSSSSCSSATTTPSMSTTTTTTATHVTTPSPTKKLFQSEEISHDNLSGISPNHSFSDNDNFSPNENNSESTKQSINDSDTKIENSFIKEDKNEAVVNSEKSQLLSDLQQHSRHISSNSEDLEPNCKRLKTEDLSIIKKSISNEDHQKVDKEEEIEKGEVDKVEVKEEEIVTMGSAGDYCTNIQTKSTNVINEKLKLVQNKSTNENSSLQSDNTKLNSSLETETTRSSLRKGHSRDCQGHRLGQRSSTKVQKANEAGVLNNSETELSLCSQTIPSHPASPSHPYSSVPSNVIPLFPLGSDLPDSPASPTPTLSPSSSPPSLTTSTPIASLMTSSSPQSTSPSLRHQPSPTPSSPLSTSNRSFPSSNSAFPPFNSASPVPSSSSNQNAPKFNDFFSEMCTRLIRITAQAARKPLQNMLKEIGIQRGMLDETGCLSTSSGVPYTNSDFMKCDLEVLRAWRLCTMKSVMTSHSETHTPSRAISPSSSLGSNSPIASSPIPTETSPVPSTSVVESPSSTVTSDPTLNLDPASRAPNTIKEDEILNAGSKSRRRSTRKGISAATAATASLSTSTSKSRSTAHSTSRLTAHSASSSRLNAPASPSTLSSVRANDKVIIMEMMMRSCNKDDEHGPCLKCLKSILASYYNWTRNNS